MPETLAIRQQFQSIFPGGTVSVTHHIIGALRSRSINDKFWKVLQEFLWVLNENDSVAGVPRGRHLSNEALLEQVQKFNPLNCNRLLGYLAGVYAEQPIEHYFWKAAAAALADHRSKSQ